MKNKANKNKKKKYLIWMIEFAMKLSLFCFWKKNGLNLPAGMRMSMGKPVACVWGSFSVRPPQSLQHFSEIGQQRGAVVAWRTIIFFLCPICGFLSIGPTKNWQKKKKKETGKKKIGIGIFFKVENVDELLRRFCLGARAHAIGHTGGGNHHW